MKFDPQSQPPDDMTDCQINTYIRSAEFAERLRDLNARDPEGAKFTIAERATLLGLPYWYYEACCLLKFQEMLPCVKFFNDIQQGTIN